MTRPPSMGSRRDVQGGLWHLAAELGALAALLGLMVLIAWLMLAL